MDLLEIIMLIIGLFIIILSCRIVARPGKDNISASSSGNITKDIYLQEGLEAFKEQQSDILSSVSEETIAKTDDYLSKLSNEKIMAVSEYSDQILEKITRNHEEVVFLYSMLNHKEKELKDIVKVFDNSQNKANELINNETEEDKSEQITTKPKQLGEQANKIRINNKPITELEDIGVAIENSTQPAISFNNAEILKKYNQGRSVLDIAKELGIGQGEVKLVIDLFKNR